MLSHQICNDTRLWEAYPKGTTASNRVSKQTAALSPRRYTMVQGASEKARKVCEASRIAQRVGMFFQALGENRPEKPTKTSSRAREHVVRTLVLIEFIVFTEELLSIAPNSLILQTHAINRDTELLERVQEVLNGSPVTTKLPWEVQRRATARPLAALRSLQRRLRDVRTKLIAILPANEHRLHLLLLVIIRNLDDLFIIRNLDHLI